MHMVVVGGGPTGVEYAGSSTISSSTTSRSGTRGCRPPLKITLVEALPTCSPPSPSSSSSTPSRPSRRTRLTSSPAPWSRTLGDLGHRPGRQQGDSRDPLRSPVWATGNTSRPITLDLMSKLLPATQTQRRGLAIDDYLQPLGARDVFAIGDRTATQYAPTAQVASQEGIYLASVFAKLGQKNKYERWLADLRARAPLPPTTLRALSRSSTAPPSSPPSTTRTRARSPTLARRRPLLTSLFNGNVASVVAPPCSSGVRLTSRPSTRSVTVPLS
jgi:NADH:ubiquinone reductase (non-electrogenic)